MSSYKKKEAVSLAALAALAAAMQKRVVAK